MERDHVIAPAKDFRLIINPISGKGRGHAVAETVYKRLLAAGLSGSMVMTQQREDERRLAEEALTTGVSLIIVCGGDGTIHQVVNVLAHSPATLGIVPCGKGNDLARALGIPRNPLAAANVILAGVTRTIDLGRLNNRYFSTIATLGFDTEVGRLVNEKGTPFSGMAAYLYAALKTLWYYQCPVVTLSGDFGTFTGPMFLAATGNSASYGGGMWIVPSATMDDGVLDICIIKEVARRTVLRMLPTVFWGGHIRHPAVMLARTKRLTVESPHPLWFLADGEPICSTPAIIEVAERALTVLTAP
jgi:diacylglycerol kinase (ATP)